MAKFEIKLKALKLRREGDSIGLIAKKLGVSKGTSSVWCRDIELTETQQELLIKNSNDRRYRGRLLGAAKNRAKKIAVMESFIERGKKEIAQVSSREYLIAGISLYWAEGSKKDARVMFTNSEPAMITFMHRWFTDMMGVKREDFMPRIFINEMHRQREKKVLNFWSSLLELPIEQFGNMVFLKMKQKKVYENYENYYGVLTIRIRKASQLKYRILGLIDAMKGVKMSG